MRFESLYWGGFGEMLGVSKGWKIVGLVWGRGRSIGDV